MAWRWSSVITPRSTLTPVTPGSGETAAVTSLVMRSLSEQPADGQQHLDRDQAAGVDRDVLDHVEVGDGPVDLGVHHLPEGCHDLVARDHQRRFPSQPCRAKQPVSWSVASTRVASPPRTGVGSE